MTWVTCQFHGVQWIKCEECGPAPLPTQFISAAQLVMGYQTIGPSGKLEYRAYKVLNVEGGVFEVETPRPYE